MNATLRESGDRIVRGAVAGGLASGIIIDIALFLLEAKGDLRAMVGLWQWNASLAIGATAMNSPSFAALGLLLHFIVSFIWAGVYSYVAIGRPQLITRPLLSGIAFGVFVWFAMQVVLVAANAYTKPTPQSFAIGILLHVVCFGIPLAYAVARVLAPRT